MEYALEGSNHEYIRHCRCSLNPCSNGICSRRKTPFAYTRLSNRRLNPCSNGICSRRYASIGQTSVPTKVLILVLMEYALEVVLGTNARNGFMKVLILVLMEYALEDLPLAKKSENPIRVLILVLMEYALEVIFIIHQLYDVKYCLNPCSNGICSRSESNDKQSGTSAKLS